MKLLNISTSPCVDPSGKSIVMVFTSRSILYVFPSVSSKSPVTTISPGINTVFSPAVGGVVLNSEELIVVKVFGVNLHRSVIVILSGNQIGEKSILNSTGVNGTLLNTLSAPITFTVVVRGSSKFSTVRTALL